jgi:hypothetical protein
MVSGPVGGSGEKRPIQPPPVKATTPGSSVAQSQVPNSAQDFDPLGEFLKEMDGDDSEVSISESVRSAPISAEQPASGYSRIFDDEDSQSGEEQEADGAGAEKDDFDLDIFEDPILKDLLGDDDDEFDEEGRDDELADYQESTDKVDRPVAEKPVSFIEQSNLDEVPTDDENGETMANQSDYDGAVSAPVKDVKPATKPPFSRPIQRGPLPRKFDNTSVNNKQVNGAPQGDKANRPGGASSGFSAASATRNDGRAAQKENYGTQPVQKQQYAQQSSQGRVIEQRGGQGAKDFRSGAGGAANTEPHRSKPLPTGKGVGTAPEQGSNREMGAQSKPNKIAHSLKSPSKEHSNLRKGESDARDEERSEQTSSPSGGHLRQRDRADIEDSPKLKSRNGRLFGWLVSYENPDGRAIELREGRFFITGSTIRGADLILEDQSISTPHSLVSITESGMQMQDLMSERGTFVRADGDVQYVRQDGVVNVSHGDWIRYGDVEFLVVIVPG